MVSGAAVLRTEATVLSGTNSHDRKIGAEGIVETLLRRGAIGLVTTHDLALTEIAEIPALRGRNVHMCARTESEPLDFDYLVKPGVNTQTNALAINIEASNTWNFFQAKTIRQTVLRTASESLEIEMRTLASAQVEAATKRAVVIGASFIGLEVAAAMVARGKTVAVAAPDPVPLAKVLGAAVGRFVQGLHEDKGVRFHLGRGVRSEEHTSELQSH